MTYSLNDDLTLTQFEELRSSGAINPAATYADYLELRQEREERAIEANRLGLTGDDPPELSEEVEMLLSEVWNSIGQHRLSEERKQVLGEQQERELAHVA
jgi:hypothetical protein